LKTIQTACPLDCWDACGMVATVDDNGSITKLDGDPKHPITAGVICGKGKKLADRLYHKDRILYPLKKIDGRFERVSWEQVLDELAQEMMKIRAEYGPTALLHHYDYGSGTLLKALETRFLNLYGGFTDTVGSLCWGSGLEAQALDFGYAASNGPEDMALHSEHIVVWGRNVPVTNMHMVPFIRRALARGATLTIINPTPTDLDSKASAIIRPRPGTDGALALGIANLLIESNAIDHAFIQNHTIGFESFRDLASQYTLDHTEQITGVSQNDIRNIAQKYADSKPLCTLLGIGLQRYVKGGSTIRAIDALTALSGNIGIAGGGVNYANRGISQFFDWDAFTAVEKRYAYREFTKITEADEIMLKKDPPIQMLLVTRSNPITAVPDTNKTRTAYDSIPIKVVIDQFMTETAKLADYILPCTNVLEEEDVVFSTMWSPYMTYVRPVTDKIGEVKTDLEIWQELANRLGFGEEMEGTAQKWIDFAFQKLETIGITRERLEKEGTIRLPIPEIAWEDRKFATASGKFEFDPNPLNLVEKTMDVDVEVVTECNSNQKCYPYYLLTVHPRKSLNSQQFSIDGVTEPIFEVSPAISAAKGLADGDQVRVWNDQGSIYGRIKIVTNMQSETIRVEQGFTDRYGNTANSLTQNRLTEIGIGSAQYDCKVNIEQIVSI
jgi:anaerobic selenocysteine-containing dehydrogenase